MSVGGEFLDARRMMRGGRRRMSASRRFAWGWIGLVLFGAIFANLLAPGGDDVQNVLGILKGPSASHVLGTDSLGRDVLTRLMYGARPTLIGAGIVVAITVGIGATCGLAAGYLGGFLDRVMTVISDVAQSIPGLLIGLVVFAVFPDKVFVVMAVSGLFMCAPMFRVVRAATMTVRNELYVTAARAAGLSHAAIIWRNIAPRVAGVVRVQASMMAAFGIAIEISLGFLGLDVAPPAPSWGSVLQDGSRYITTDAWLIFPPVAAIALTIVAFGVLGEVIPQSGGVKRGHRRGRGGGRPGYGRRQHALAPVRIATSPSPAAVPARGEELLLQVRELTVTTSDARQLELVDGVGFDVRRGQVVGLVGETGAGKSVVARSILQVGGNTIAGGSIVFDGTELVGASPSQLARLRGRRIAYVGQDPMAALDPLFRVQDQIAEVVRTHRPMGRRQAGAEAVRLLTAVRIREPEAIARKYPFEISGGQAQRVAIALALAGEPDLLIADEPTTALDVTVQMAVLGVLKEQQRERGLTIILVTHDWGVVADMCDQVVTLYAGEVAEAGPVAELFSHPSHPYTAALRKADPHLQDAGEKLAYIPGRVPPPGRRPSGCRFADRCPLVIGECRAAHPDVLPVADGRGHSSRCIRTDVLRRRADETEETTHV